MASFKAGKTSRNIVAATVLTLGLAACANVVDQRGNDPNPDMLNLLQPGEQTREDVGALLGSPSSTATFGNETWYYISSKVERRAFLAPKEIERKVVAVYFDEGGRLKEVRQYGLEDGKVVDLNPNATPTAGNEMGVLQQLLGNLGRFQK